MHEKMCLKRLDDMQKSLSSLENEIKQLRQALHPAISRESTDRAGQKGKTAFPVIASVSLGAALILKDVKEAIVKSMDFLLLEQICSRASKVRKKVREKSRECHNHKPKPFPDPRGRGNRHI